MANTQQLTPQQRAALFAANTRQHFQMIAQQEATSGGTMLSFRMPKSRILQSIKILVDAKIKVKHASGTAFTTNMLTPYKVLRNIIVDYNNGFAPIRAGAADIALMNMLNPNAHMLVPAVDDSTNCKCPATFTASSAGASNEFSFELDIPLTLNERDPVGLVLAQNAETNIDMTIDIANGSEIVDNASGYSVEIESVKVTPMTSSFSIPADSRAFPDMSVLKIMDARNEDFSSGQSHIKLPVGQIYRKMILKFTKTDGSPMTDGDITSNIDLVFNTADVPYSINPRMLRALNKTMIGKAMPSGIYFWDWSYQGISNYGGSRDTIDTETITEFMIRFTSGVAGKVTIISEKLSRLI